MVAIEIKGVNRFLEKYKLPVPKLREKKEYTCVYLELFPLSKVCRPTFQWSECRPLNLIQCTSDIVATLGHTFLSTISDWPLYPT